MGARWGVGARAGLDSASKKSGGSDMSEKPVEGRESGTSAKVGAGDGSGMSEKSMSKSSSGASGGGGGGGHWALGKVAVEGLDMVVTRAAPRCVVSSEGGGGREAAREVMIEARHKKHSPFPK